MKYLLSQSKNFYKANLHTHTTVSDGKFTPEEIKEMYKAEGYSVVAFTDSGKFETHDDLTDDTFLALNGYELTFTDHYHGTPETAPEYQLRQASDLGVIAPAGVSELPVLPYPLSSRIMKPEAINAVRKLYSDAGCFLVHHNPVYNLESYKDYMAYDTPDALEIVNFSAFLSGAAERNENIFEDMILANKRAYAVASDGNIESREDAFGAWTVINADDLSYESVTEALKNGNFYATEGPEIKEIYIDDENKVNIVTSPAASIRIATNSRTRGLCLNVDGTPVTHLRTLKLPGEHVYFRFIVTDALGRQAFSNAYFIDELYN